MGGAGWVVAAADHPALRRCAAVPPEEFASIYWSRQPLLSRADALPRDFSDLFDLDAVDELISRRGLRTPFLRIAKEGALVPAARFTGSGGTGASVADQVLDERVLQLFLDGCTLALQGLHRTWAPLADFAAAMRSDLGCPVQVNAYVTPPSEQGFSAHYDVHDVFVLQFAGEKQWRIHAPVVSDPLPDQPWTDHRGAVAAAVQQEPLLDVVLRPGDALYLPRGYLHSARARGAVSAHLTVGVHPVTRYDLVGALLEAARGEPSVRTSLPMGTDATDPHQLDRPLKDAVAALLSFLPGVPASTVADRLTPEALGSGRPVGLAPLAQAVAIASVTADTAVRLRPHLPLTVRREADGAEEAVIVVLADRQLRLPGTTRGAIEALRSGTSWPAGRLPGLGPEDGVSLVRRLLREGVVVPAAARATAP